MKLILILNLQYVLDKNLNQVEALDNFDFLFITKNKKINDEELPNNSHQKPINSAILRLLYVVYFLCFNRSIIHHMEIYPGGRLAVFFIFLSKIFGLKHVLVERGDIAFLNTYSASIRFFIEFSYKFADRVWYREYFMKKDLLDRGVKSLFFQGNFVRIDKQRVKEKSEYTFLWCNRLTQFRRSNWFVDILNKNEFSSEKSLLLGFLYDEKYKGLEDYVLAKKPDCLECLDFQAPRKYMVRSKFFVFPAVHTFANFSLLESMSYGVVPIISDVPGTEKIVQDNVNGIVCEFSQKGLELGMKKALLLSDNDYRRMSANAILTIKERFSLQAYKKNMSEFYQSL